MPSRAGARAALSRSEHGLRPRLPVAHHVECGCRRRRMAVRERRARRCSCRRGSDGHHRGAIDADSPCRKRAVDEGMGAAPASICRRARLARGWRWNVCTTGACSSTSTARPTSPARDSGGREDASSPQRAEGASIARSMLGVQRMQARPVAVRAVFGLRSGPAPPDESRLRSESATPGQRTIDSGTRVRASSARACGGPRPRGRAARRAEAKLLEMNPSSTRISPSLRPESAAGKACCSAPSVSVLWKEESPSAGRWRGGSTGASTAASVESGARPAGEASSLGLVRVPPSHVHCSMLPACAPKPRRVLGRRHQSWPRAW
jgi:hypothetical protein